MNSIVTQRSPVILTLPVNITGRDFVVGDIHGAFDMLDSALRLVNFNGHKDRLIAVGDLINRGLYSYRAMEYLDQPWFYSVMGNHEQMYPEIVRTDGTIDRVTLNERKNIDEYLWIFNYAPAQLALLREKLTCLPMAIEIQNPDGFPYGFIHGEILPGMDWRAFTSCLKIMDRDVRAAALWGRKRIRHNIDKPIDGLERLFVGHTPVKGAPQCLGNVYYTDTGATLRGRNDSLVQYGLTLMNIKAPVEMFEQPLRGALNVIDHQGLRQRPKHDIGPTFN